MSRNDMLPEAHEMALEVCKQGIFLYPKTQE